MEDQERELTKHLEDKEYIRQFVDDHKRKEHHWHSIRNLLICICVVLAIVCGIVIREWLSEIELRYYYQTQEQYYSNLATQYETLYYNCLNQEE
jgi:hypothetical protein